MATLTPAANQSANHAGDADALFQDHERHEWREQALDEGQCHRLGSGNTLSDQKNVTAQMAITNHAVRAHATSP